MEAVYSATYSGVSPRRRLLQQPPAAFRISHDMGEDLASGLKFTNWPNQDSCMGVSVWR